MADLAKHHKRGELIAYDLWEHFLGWAEPDGFKAEVVAIDRSDVRCAEGIPDELHGAPPNDGAALASLLNRLDPERATWSAAEAGGRFAVREETRGDSVYGVAVTVSDQGMMVLHLLRQSSASPAQRAVLDRVLANTRLGRCAEQDLPNAQEEDTAPIPAEDDRLLEGL